MFDRHGNTIAANNYVQFTQKSIIYYGKILKLKPTMGKCIVRVLCSEKEGVFPPRFPVVIFSIQILKILSDDEAYLIDLVKD